MVIQDLQQNLSRRRAPVKKHSTKSRRQPRTKRTERRSQAPRGQEIVPLHQEIRELLFSKLRGAVLATAQQLVEDEVTSLVGPMWSRMGDD